MHRSFLTGDAGLFHKEYTSCGAAILPPPKRSIDRGATSHINSGCIGINITRYRDTAMPFPYNSSGAQETALPCPRLSFRHSRN
ncbi:hypothetical protein QT971_31275, partial [Microcoleus sp. herbarium19]